MILQEDVVIVGGGMVGLTLALALNNHGIQVAVLEANSSREYALDGNRVETRVSAINHTSKRLLQNVGVWDYIKNSRIAPYYNMQVWDDDESTAINISAEEIAEHSLGCIVENDVIIAALLEKIKDTSIEILYNSKIIEVKRLHDKATVVLENTEIQTNLVVGADGSNSFVRDYFNFATRVKPYNHTAIVATLHLEKPHDETAYQRFYDKGILAFLPLSDLNKASIVWSVTTDYSRYLMNLEESAFESRLKEDICKVLGDVKLLSKRFSFDLIQRHAKEYAQDNVVLVGDAAHTIHPLAGQGVNLGFKDVIALDDILGTAFTKGRLIGHISTLDKYQRARRLDNTKMIATMKAFKESFASDKEIVKSIRKTGLGLVDRNTILKKIFVKQAL